MTKENKEFKHELFSLSTDYNKLWDLVNQGHRIPAWILYTDEYEDPIYDLIEVKKHKHWGSLIMGTRGMGYEPTNATFEKFEDVCKRLELKFIEPCHP